MLLSFLKPQQRQLLGGNVWGDVCQDNSDASKRKLKTNRCAILAQREDSKFSLILLLNFLILSVYLTLFHFASLSCLFCECCYLYVFLRY